MNCEDYEFDTNIQMVRIDTNELWGLRIWCELIRMS